jgi:hypothetical protein
VSVEISPDCGSGRRNATKTPPRLVATHIVNPVGDVYALPTFRRPARRDRGLLLAVAPP